MKNSLDAFGYNWDISKGMKNTICDVKGVRVGNYTKKIDNIRTGITTIIPSSENIFKHKLIAACHVINGFGKSCGLIQVDELGTIESPIVLTNTLAIGTAQRALIKHALKHNIEIGVSTGSFNPIVGECNDMELNDIRNFSLDEDEFLNCIENASYDFEQGDVGAGAGTICYELKGGIGSASRLINIENQNYTIGILVQSNFGSLEDLTVKGVKLGKEIKVKLNTELASEDKGSIMVVLATDLPVSSRQLKRLLKRVQSGIARTGGYTGNGSGEVAIGFSTANIIEHFPKKAINKMDFIHDDYINICFKAVVEATEEAVLNSMLYAKMVKSKDKKVHSLAEFI